MLNTYLNIYRIIEFTFTFPFFGYVGFEFLHLLFLFQKLWHIFIILIIFLWTHIGLCGRQLKMSSNIMEMSAIPKGNIPNIPPRNTQIKGSSPLLSPTDSSLPLFVWNSTRSSPYVPPPLIFLIYSSISKLYSTICFSLSSPPQYMPPDIES